MSDEIGKGRATPSRKEAEAARRKAMKQPLTRKEQAKREREARTTIRTKQQAALRGEGNDSFLPPRDRGPVRRFVRDYVDRRWNLGEFALLFLAAALVLQMLFSVEVAYYGNLMLMVYLLLVVVDGFRMTRGLKNELKVRFPDSPTPGTTFYALLRMLQIRRFRLPKPTLKRGDALPVRY